jgi:nitroreductase
MHKRAPTDFPVHDFIAERWSPRAFSDESVPTDVLESLFEAARWAPSSSNEQPWTYLVGTKEDPENFQKIVSVLVPGNQAWAPKAPVLAIAVAAVTSAKTGKPHPIAPYDVGAASAWLTVEATSRGLVVHQMGGFDREKTREVFAIPEGWNPMAAMAIGYPGDPETLSTELRERENAPRTRKPISQFVMSGTWGQKATFLP